jgi:hypothetical protein
MDLSTVKRKKWKDPTKKAIDEMVKTMKAELAEKKKAEKMAASEAEGSAAATTGGKRKAGKEPAGSKKATKVARKEVVVAIEEGAKISEKVAAVAANGDGDPFHAVMSLTDMGVGELGQNSFYKMQLIKYTKGNNAVVFATWGRVGGDAQTMTKNFKSQGAAEVKTYSIVFVQHTCSMYTVCMQCVYSMLTSIYMQHTYM